VHDLAEKAAQALYRSAIGSPLSFWSVAIISIVVLYSKRGKTGISQVMGKRKSSFKGTGKKHSKTE
jgi:hypothetical protein